MSIIYNKPLLYHVLTCELLLNKYLSLSSKTKFHHSYIGEKTIYWLEAPPPDLLYEYLRLTSINIPIEIKCDFFRTYLISPYISAEINNHYYLLNPDKEKHSVQFTQRYFTSKLLINTGINIEIKENLYCKIATSYSIVRINYDYLYINGLFGCSLGIKYKI